MKWDYATVTKWGLDEVGPEGQNRFDLAVVELAKRLQGEIEKDVPLNGYQVSFQITREGHKLVHCLTSGTGSAKGSSQFIAASTAAEVYPVLQDMFPDHAVARLDACEDYTGPGAYERLEGMLAAVCTKHRVSMRPYGEGHTRPDGTRDVTKGRTWYCGSKNSPFQVVLYEKGLEQLAKGIPDDPLRVRLEVRIKPASRAKEMLGTFRLHPSDLLGMSRWGREVGEYLGACDLRPVAIGSVWKPNEEESLALKIVRMFDNGIERMIEQYTPEQFGLLVFDAHRKNREAMESIDALTR